MMSLFFILFLFLSSRILLHITLNHGGRSVPEGTKGIVWSATLSNDGSSGRIFCDGKAVP
jgi:hypothetical protein